MRFPSIGRIGGSGYSARRARNPKIAIEVQVQAVVGTPIETVRDALLTAIEADDDILTQNLDASELKVAIQKASSFEAVVQVLRTARAIEV